MITQQDRFLFLETKGRVFRVDLNRRPVGSGAMGTVFLGVDCNTGEKVAVKRVFDKYANIPEIRKRAKQEASLMFRHDNLIEMLGCCEYEPDYGPIFIISKFVYGVNINKYLDYNMSRDKDSCMKICNMFMPVLEALEYLHAKNILHLDVKPSNIMVENGRNVRLMDLGIAQIAWSGGSSTTNGMIGTPKYAAPEQMQYGTSVSTPTFRSDIYEAAVTLYELLTGNNPYSGDSLEEIKEKHYRLELPENQIVPRPVLEVLRKATDPDPLQRYATVWEFKTSLRQALLKPRVDYRYWVIGSIALLTIIILLIIMITMIYG